MISLNYGLNGTPLVMLNHLRLDGLLKLCVHEFTMFGYHSLKHQLNIFQTEFAKPVMNYGQLG